MPSSAAVAANGADIVLRVLEAEAAEICFGMPGGAILPIYDAIARGTTVRHVLVRHEQGAGHMAEGYARATGRPGVVFATSGPGATNLVTPIADAKLDSIPLVCVTGQVRTDVIGTDAFQECNIVGVVQPLVKGAWQVRDVAELAETLHAAFALACSGRHGPVLVDIPRDVQEAPAVEAYEPPVAVRAAQPRAPADELRRAAAMIDGSQRPVLYVGGGAQGCAHAVRALAERAGVPVVTTLMGKGAFPESHRLFVGWPGMHGTKAANRALHVADLILAAGVRFDDRVTGRVDAFAPSARVIHIDIDSREHGKIRRPDLALHSDLGEALVDLIALVAPAPIGRDAWRERITGWERRHPLGHAAGVPGGRLKPQLVVARIADLVAGREDVVWTTGVGQHQMWAMQYARVDRPRTFITSGGLGTMGYGLPAALGAQLARPGATTVCIDGDGSFQMTLQELATAVAEQLPIIVVILNNGRLGMVDQWQTMFYEQRRSASDLRVGAPSFSAIARAYGATGLDVATENELDAAVATALAAVRPVVLDVAVDRDESCFPMILPGGAAADQVEWHEWAT
jgi:acetolactate synthase-1/2/3 large subunit